MRFSGSTMLEMEGSDLSSSAKLEKILDLTHHIGGPKSWIHRHELEKLLEMALMNSPGVAHSRVADMAANEPPRKRRDYMASGSVDVSPSEGNQPQGLSQGEQNLRKRTWELYDDIECHIYPIFMAKVGYSYIRLEETPYQDETNTGVSLEDEKLAEWLESLGIPSNHIMTDARRAYFSGSLSPHCRLLGSTDLSILRCLAERKIKWHLSSNIRQLRKGKITTAEYVNMTRRIMRRLKMDKDEVIDIALNDSHSPLQLADQFWSLYVELISELPNSSSSRSPSSSSEKMTSSQAKVQGDAERDRPPITKKLATKISRSCNSSRLSRSNEEVLIVVESYLEP